MDEAIFMTVNKTFSRTVGRPRVRFRTPAQLLGRQDEMWAVMSAIVTMPKQEWEQDFLATRLYAVFYASGRIIGYTRVMEETFETSRGKIDTIGLGQAIILPEYRNQFLVQRALIFRWVRRFLRTPFRPIYIWGACISYKSYLSFTRVLRVVYPRQGIVTPGKHADVIHLIGERWYGAAYNRDTGSTRVTGIDLFDPGVLPTDSDRMDPDIRFFEECTQRNGDHITGLLTISPCIRENFLPMIFSWMGNFVRKMFGIRKKRKK